MNLYHYKHENGVQFVSRANYLQLILYAEIMSKKNNNKFNTPKLLGVWRLKKINKK